MADLQDLIQRSQEKRRVQTNYQPSAVPQPPQPQGTPVVASPVTHAKEAVQSMGGFLGGILKNVFWEIPKDITKSLATTVGQSVWAIRKSVTGDAAAELGDSPLFRRWAEQQNLTAETFERTRYPNASEVAIKQKAQQTKKDHPFATWFSGPLNSILDVTMAGEAVQLGARAAATRLAPQGLKGTMAAQELLSPTKFVGQQAWKVLSKSDAIQGAANSLKSRLAFRDWWGRQLSHFYDERSQFRVAVDQKFKDLNIDQQAFVDFLEGIPQMRQAIKGERVQKAGFSPDAMETLNWMKNVAKRQTKVLVQRGILKAEQAQRRVFGPMAKTYLAEKFPETSKMSLKEALTFVEKKGVQADEVYASVKSIADRAGIDPVYFRHLFEDKMKMGETFIPSPVRATRGGYRKQYAGVEGYMQDAAAVAKFNDASVKRDIFTKNLVDDIVQGRSPVKVYATLDDIPDHLRGQYTAWDYQGALRFFPTQAGEKTVIGVSRNVPKIFIPKNIKDTLTKFFSSASSGEKLARAVLDPITDTWRFSVLALSPRWYINNTVGNFLLNALAGITPLDYVRYGGKKWLQYVPKEIRREIERGGIASVEKATTKFGAAANLAKGVPGKLFNVNQSIEQFFRRVHYGAMARKAARQVQGNLSPEALVRVQGALKNTDFDGITTMISSQNKAVQKQAIASVDKFLFNYGKLSLGERQYIRRIVPFYSWYKNIFQLSAKLAYENPGRLALMYRMWQGLGAVSDPDMPEWIRNRVPLPLSITDPTSKKQMPLFVSFRAAMPFSDMLRMTDPTEILTSINPVAKIAIERVVKKELYGMKDFTSPYYDPYTGMTYDPKTGDVSQEKPLPDLLYHIAQQFPSFTLIEDIVKPYSKYSTGEPIVDANGSARYGHHVVLTLLKQFGVNAIPFDAQSYLKNQMSSKESTKNYVEKRIKGLQKFRLQEESRKKMNDMLEKQKVWDVLLDDQPSS